VAGARVVGERVVGRIGAALLLADAAPVPAAPRRAHLERVEDRRDFGDVRGEPDDRTLRRGRGVKDRKGRGVKDGNRRGDAGFEKTMTESDHVPTIRATNLVVGLS